MSVSQIFAYTPVIGQLGAVGGSATAITLDAAYDNGVSGDALAIRYMAPTTASIDAIWVFVTAVTGSPTLRARVYGENTTWPTRPNTGAATATSSAADTPTANQWAKITFGTPHTPAAIGELCWIVVDNPTGSSSVDLRTGTATILVLNTPVNPYTSITGFTTSGTLVSETPFFIKQGSLYYGNPFTSASSAPYASSALERGIKFTMPCSAKVFGVSFGTLSANTSHFKIYAGGAVPGGTSLLDIDLDASPIVTADEIGARVFSELTLDQGSTYYATLTFSAALTGPGALQIENYAGYTTEIDALRNASTFVFPTGIISNAGVTAFDEDKSLCPQMALYISDYPTATGGSTGGPARVIGG